MTGTELLGEEPPIHPFDIAHVERTPINIYLRESVVKGIRAGIVPHIVPFELGGESRIGLFNDEHAVIKAGYGESLLQGGKLKNSEIPTAMEIVIPDHTRSAVELLKLGLSKAVRKLHLTQREPRYRAEINLFSTESLE